MDAELERRIRERAYALWERDGRAPGRADAHWREAERQLTERHGDAAAAAAAPSPADSARLAARIAARRSTSR
jgi:hypothetical protein